MPADCLESCQAEVQEGGTQISSLPELRRPKLESKEARAARIYRAKYLNGQEAEVVILCSHPLSAEECPGVSTPSIPELRR